MHPFTHRIRPGLLPVLCISAASPLVASAEDPTPILEVGETIDLRDMHGLELSGNWARVYPKDDGGWTLFITGGDTYNVMDMNESFEVTSERRRLVDGWAHRLVDHQITRCPDGTWLHVASANITEDNDSAYLFRYDADFNLLCSATVAESDPVYRYNDAPLVCTGGATAESPMDGTASHTEEALPVTPFVFFDGSCNRIHDEPHPTSPPVAGASIVYDETGGYFWEVRTAPDDPTLLFQLYGPWMEPVDKSHSRDALVPEGFTTRWPQSALMIGDYYFVAHLARDPGRVYTADSGDIWVQVFDRNLVHIQSVRLTDLGEASGEGHGGAHRPWMSWRDDTLVVVYDQALWPRLVPLTLDRVLLGLDAGDTGDRGGDEGGEGGEGEGDGGLDSAEAPESIEAGGPASRAPAGASGCSGCASGGPPAGRGAWLVLLGLIGLGLRRRDTVR